MPPFVDGRTLVPDIAGGLERAIQGFQKAQVDAKDRKRQNLIDINLDVLTGAGESQRDKDNALLELTRIDPTVGLAVKQIVESQNRAEIERVDREAEDGLRIAGQVISGKTPERRREIFRELVREKLLQGKDIKADLDLLNLTDDEFDIRMKARMRAGTAIKTLTKPNLPTFRQLPGGGQINEQTGQVIADPTDPKPFVLSPGQTRFDSSGNQLASVPLPVKPTAPTEPKPFTLSPGQIRFDPSGRELASVPVPIRPTVPTEPKPFTLSAGQTRFDPTGRELASVPATPPTVKPVPRFEPVFAEDGRTIVGQRNTLTGEVKSDPRSVNDTTLIQNLRAIGVDPETEEGNKLVKKILTTAKTKVDINKGQLSFKIPEGFMLNNPERPEEGVKPIPGGPRDNVTGESAGKAQSLRTAQNAFPDIEGLVFDEDGDLNDVNLVNAQLGTPLTDGRELRQKMELGIQAITRIETGAAMAPSELDNTRLRFMPQPFDTKELARFKLDMFKDFVNGTLKLIDPTGRFSEERFLTEFQKRVNDRKEAETKQKSKVQNMSDAELLKRF